MLKIAVLPNLTKMDAAFHTTRILKKLLALGAQPLMLGKDCPLFGDLALYHESSAALLTECDVVIAVGGDGTIIRAAKEAMQFDRPVLGINVGRLGFVAGLETDELDRLKNLIEGKFILDERMVLKAELDCDGLQRQYYALNDAVIARGALSRILDLEVLFNETIVCDYRADGLILSTPTGSTAYSLSAGGPVIDPSMKCILLSPICPHSLMTRTVVFGEASKLKVRVNSSGNESEAFLTIDGEISISLKDFNSYIHFEKAPQTAKIIKLKNTNFYEIVNNKLAERRA